MSAAPATAGSMPAPPPAPLAAVAAPARPPTALSAGNDDDEKRLPWFFDPGTYGGVIVLTIFLIVAPLALKEALEASGMDGNQVGVALSGVFVIHAAVSALMLAFPALATAQVVDLVVAGLQDHEDVAPD